MKLWSDMREAMKCRDLHPPLTIMHVTAYCVYMIHDALFCWMVTNNDLLHVSGDCLAQKWDQSQQNIAHGDGHIHSLSTRIRTLTRRCFNEERIRSSIGLSLNARSYRELPLTVHRSTAVPTVKSLHEHPRSAAHREKTCHWIKRHAAVEDGGKVAYPLATAKVCVRCLGREVTCGRGPMATLGTSSHWLLLGLHWLLQAHGSYTWGYIHLARYHYQLIEGATVQPCITLIPGAHHYVIGLYKHFAEIPWVELLRRAIFQQTSWSPRGAPLQLAPPK